MTREEIEARDEDFRRRGWQVCDTFEEFFKGTPLELKPKKEDTVSPPFSESKKKKS